MDGTKARGERQVIAVEVRWRERAPTGREDGGRGGGTRERWRESEEGEKGNKLRGTSGERWRERRKRKSTRRGTKKQGERRRIKVTRNVFPLEGQSFWVTWKLSHFSRQCQETDEHSDTNRGFCFISSFGGIRKPSKLPKITGPPLKCRGGDEHLFRVKISRRLVGT